MLSGISKNHRNIAFGRNNSDVVRIYKSPNTNVSDKFTKGIMQTFQKQPVDPKIRRVIERIQNPIICLVENIQQILPNMKKTPGVFQWGLSSYKPNKPAYLVLFENKEARERPDPSAVIRHEFGHHADFMFRKFTGSHFSETSGLAEVITADKKAINGNKTMLLRGCCPDMGRAVTVSNYFTEGLSCTGLSAPEREELFADIFAKECGGSAGEELCKGMDTFYEKAFPNTVEYVKKLLWLLGKR